ncbi:hypothetical protein L596_020457 [Steinernema carpocapsae]|uniref:Uncharacterized protein n=1 Tax=Steinernema carpocapsae TaxID=34508 RepID=A0A4U5MTL2_STECR|nr:hypothetical protein L596_020457 [Steinernema carpocapsae]
MPRGVEVLKKEADVASLGEILRDNIADGPITKQTRCSRKEEVTRTVTRTQVYYITSGPNCNRIGAGTLSAYLVSSNQILKLRSLLA